MGKKSWKGGVGEKKRESGEGREVEMTYIFDELPLDSQD